MKRFIAFGSSLLLLALVQFSAAQKWTANGPLPRYGQSAVFDPSTRQMIIFGGNSQGYTKKRADLDVWRLLPSASLSGVQNWVPVYPGGSNPHQRWGHFAAYDQGSNRMIVFAGTGSDTYSDVWVLTHANGHGGYPTWIQVSGGGPPPRYFAATAYDPVSNTLMTYSGSGVPDYWLLSHANGLGGTPIWTYVSSLEGGPGTRVGQTAVYDASTNELIVFAGSDQHGNVYNDVWVLKNANGTGATPVWQQLFPTGEPPAARAYTTAIYDPASGVMTVFGGSLGLEMGDTNDTWFLSNANGAGGTPSWTTFSQNLTDDPRYRDSHSAVYDASRNVMIIYGGEDSHYSSGMSDVFFLSHANGH